LIKYYLSIIILVLFFLLLWIPQLLAQETNRNFFYNFYINHTVFAEKEALDSMLKSFQLFSSLFTDVYMQGDYIIPLHGQTMQELIDYLAEGFENDLASDIIETYFTWNCELNKPVVIPCDLIPVLTDLDRAEIKSFTDCYGNIYFYRFYDNCYYQGDRYYYQVSTYFTGYTWKIKSIRFESILK